jgi:deoxyribodipyrimidine photo-lyase
MFPTDFASVLQRIDQIDPARYGRTRNFMDGAVTRLSPYISRGVISTKQVFKTLITRGYRLDQMFKLVQELAWRDYWQQVWVHKGEAINEDLRHPQSGVENYKMPVALAKGSTGIRAMDEAVESFYETGYIHNHMRMYMASVACNIGKSHWKLPARWMYYHLLDGDWASNALSWQWVCGSNSNKKYLANQENINKFFHSDQKGTFLDRTYEDLATMEVPPELQETFIPDLSTPLPDTPVPDLDRNLPTLVYTSYNLDPGWRTELTANRVLLLEPSHFEHYPVSEKTLRFLLDLSANIPGIRVLVGEFETLATEVNGEIYFKEHPLTTHYRGIQDPRDWMFPVEGYFRSFFAFWKKCERFLPEFMDQR